MPDAAASLQQQGVAAASRQQLQIQAPQANGAPSLRQPGQNAPQQQQLQIQGPWVNGAPSPRQHGQYAPQQQQLQIQGPQVNGGPYPQQYSQPVPRQLQIQGPWANGGPYSQQYSQPVPQQLQIQGPWANGGPYPQQYSQPVPRQLQIQGPWANGGPYPQQYSQPVPQQLQIQGPWANGGPYPQQYSQPVPQQLYAQGPQVNGGPYPQQYGPPVPRQQLQIEGPPAQPPTQGVINYPQIDLPAPSQQAASAPYQPPPSIEDDRELEHPLGQLTDEEWELFESLLSALDDLCKEYSEPTDTDRSKLKKDVDEEINEAGINQWCDEKFRKFKYGLYLHPDKVRLEAGRRKLSEKNLKELDSYATHICQVMGPLMSQRPEGVFVEADPDEMLRPTRPRIRPPWDDTKAGKQFIPHFKKALAVCQKAHSIFSTDKQQVSAAFAKNMNTINLGIAERNRDKNRRETLGQIDFASILSEWENPGTFEKNTTSQANWAWLQYPRSLARSPPELDISTLPTLEDVRWGYNILYPEQETVLETSQPMKARQHGPGRISMHAVPRPIDPRIRYSGPWAGAPTGPVATGLDVARYGLPLYTRANLNLQSGTVASTRDLIPGFSLFGEPIVAMDKDAGRKPGTRKYVVEAGPNIYSIRYEGQSGGARIFDMNANQPDIMPILSDVKELPPDAKEEIWSKADSTVDLVWTATHSTVKVNPSRLPTMLCHAMLNNMPFVMTRTLFQKCVGRQLADSFIERNIRGPDSFSTGSLWNALAEIQPAIQPRATGASHPQLLLPGPETQAVAFQPPIQPFHSNGAFQPTQPFHSNGALQPTQPWQSNDASYPTQPWQSNEALNLQSDPAVVSSGFSGQLSRYQPTVEDTAMLDAEVDL